MKRSFLFSIVVLFFVLLLVSCKTTDPLLDPLREGADLPKVLPVENPEDYFFYALLRYQEAKKKSGNSKTGNSQTKLANKQKHALELLKEAAAYLRLGLEEGKLKQRVSEHEWYQNLLVDIAFSSADALRAKFLNRMVVEYERWFVANRDCLDAKYLFARALALCDDRSQEDRAIILSKQILENKPDHYRALLLLGSIFYSDKKYMQAIVYLKRAIAPGLKNRETSPLKLLARVYKDAGRISDAIEYYEFFINLSSRNQLTISDYENLANLYIDVGNYEKAEQLLTNDLPPTIAARGYCHHLKTLGRVEVLISKKLAKQLKKNYSNELEDEIKLIYKSAKFSFEQYLEYFPDDEEAKSLLLNLKNEHKFSN